MIVNSYKKPKKVHFSVYYNKGYFYSRRFNYYGYNKYKNYYNYYKLQNYKRNIPYELQNREKKSYKKTHLEKGEFRQPTKELKNNKLGLKEKRDINRKKCIIKILKRPTELKNDDCIKKNGEIEEKKGNEHNEKKKIGKKDNIKDKGKEKNAFVSSKKTKEGFKFTSTQELFNLLLKDVKGTTNDDLVSNEGSEKKLFSTNNTKESTKSLRDIQKTNLKKKILIKSEIKEAIKKENISENIELEKKINKENITNNSDSSLLEYLNNNKEEIYTNGFYSSILKNTVKDNNDNDISIKEKNNKTVSFNGITTEYGNDKYIMKNIDKDLLLKTCNDGYTKSAVSKSLYSISYPNLITYGSKIELCKNNSLRNDYSKIEKKEEDTNLFVIPLYMRSPKPEQIPIPVHLSVDNKNLTDEVISLKDKSKIERRKDSNDIAKKAIHINSTNDININNSNNTGPGCSNTSNEHRDKILNSYNIKTKNQTKKLKEHINMNMYKDGFLNLQRKNGDKKRKKTYLNRNFISFNAEQNSKLNYDVVNLNIGNLKKNGKMYNSYSHTKVGTSNYNNGNNQNKNGKYFKVDKSFHNRKYKIRENLNDNKKNRNINFVKDVKIAVY